MSRAVLGITAAGLLLTACTSTRHPVAQSSPAPSTPVSTVAPSGSSSPVLAPLLPGASVSTSAAPWSKAYAGTQFTNLVEQFASATSVNAPGSGASFADYVQYSQQIALACDPFLNGLRSGLWPEDAQTAIVAFTRLQQVVCDVELARGQAGTVEQYKGVPPPPPDADKQLLDYRVEIYKLLGV